MLLPACPVIPGFYYRRGKKKALKKVIMKDAVWKDIHLSLVDEAGENRKTALE